MENYIPYWSNGELVDVEKFCVNTPDEVNITNICLFMTHSSEDWCGSIITRRLDDATCSGKARRICMERVEDTI